jgi:hypothetical protein
MVSDGVILGLGLGDGQWLRCLGLLSWVLLSVLFGARGSEVLWFSIVDSPLNTFVASGLTRAWLYEVA